MNVILYSYFRSSASYRVRIALELKNIPYAYQSVHLLKSGGEQHAPAYVEINPMHEVPTLVHEGRRLSQSLPILDYLDQVWPTPMLFPLEPYARARVSQFCENINSGIHPYQNLKLLQRLEALYGLDAEAKADWSRHWIRRGFQALEKMLQQTAGTYCFGGSITAADCFLVPQILNAHRFKLDLREFPILSRIFDACMRVPAFQVAHPSEQPDAEI